MVLKINHLRGFNRKRSDAVGPALSFVAGGTSESNSITIPGTEAVNDLIVILAFNIGSTTVPTIPASPWVSDVNQARLNSGAGGATRIGHKIVTSAPDTSGTWTNSDHMACVVLRNVNLSSPIGNIAEAFDTISPPADLTAPAVALTPGHNNRNHILICANFAMSLTVSWPEFSGFTRVASDFETAGTGSENAIAIYLSDAPLTGDFAGATSTGGADIDTGVLGYHILWALEIRAV
jgi:hypothetical protein